MREEWRHAAPRPEIVKEVFLWKPETDGGGGLFRLNQAAGVLERAEAPEATEAARRVQRLGGPPAPGRAWIMEPRLPALV